MKTVKNLNNKTFFPAIILVIILAITFALSVPLTSGFAFADSEQASYVDNTLDFAEDRVLVVLGEQETKTFKNYTEKDFSELGVSSVKELTKSSKEKLYKQIQDADKRNQNSFDYQSDGMEIEEDSFRSILCLTLEKPGKDNVLKAIDLLKKRSDIISAEPDTVLHIEVTNPNDPKFQDGTQWGMNGDYGINATSAWSYTSGVSVVRVGVIDTGIDADHEDLADNVNTDLSRDFSLAEPYIPATVVDNGTHGSHVAGIIGATGNNAIGVTGVAQSIELVSLRISPTDLGDSFASHLILAIDYATTANIPILNNSNGTDGYTGTDDSLTAFTTAVTNYPGLFVTSAGNGDRNNDENTNRFPSNVRLSNLITVGAISSEGTRASYSNYGATTVDIFAPGDAIYSTLPNNRYGNKSGTSMATPHVTGVAALILSYMQDISHNMTAKQLSNHIKTTIMNNAIVDEGAPLDGLCVSGGRLNAYGAVRNFPARVTAMDGFGYNSSWYKWNGKVDLTVRATAYSLNSSDQPIFTQNVPLSFSIGTKSVYNAWFEIVSSITFELKDSAGNNVAIGGNAIHSSSVRVGLVSNVSYTNGSFTINTGSLANDTYTLYLHSVTIRDGVSYTHDKSFTFVVNISSACVAEGTEITLADGSQIAVEDLTGNEDLLVWNMLTGQFDTAPILFVDCDPYTEYEIIELTFSDGTSVKVIDEHGFFNTTLNEYVFLRRDASQYIGDWFNKQSIDDNGNMIWTTVQLTDVDVYNEYTTAWSPVTYSHLCLYVNGMLSMPGATEGFINIFEVNPTTMTYDTVAMTEDIATYGLYTYEEFCELIPISEEIFNAFNGQYLKVSIGKGLIDMEGIAALVERYAPFFVTEESLTENDIEPEEIRYDNGNHFGRNNGDHFGQRNGKNK